MNWKTSYCKIPIIPKLLQEVNVISIKIPAGGLGWGREGGRERDRQTDRLTDLLKEMSWDILKSI
jgi:hypothetical protein